MVCVLINGVEVNPEAKFVISCVILKILCADFLV